MIVGFAIGLMVLLLVVVVLLPTGFKLPEIGGGAGGNGGGITGANATPTPSGPVALEPLDEPPEPAVIATVYDGPKLEAAARKNAWMQQTLSSPLGKGFLGAWVGFLGSRGEDLKGSFTGTVQDLLLDKILAKPFQLVWFTGDAARSTPALVLDDPDSSARGAFEALDATVQRGTYTAPACPEAESAAASETPTPADDAAASATATPEPKYEISRWVVADQSIYGLEGKGPGGQSRLVIGRVPQAAFLGLCADLGKLERPADTDLEITVVPDTLGRGSQSLAELLGIGPAPRLAFKVDGDRLVPRGIAAETANGRKLGVAAVSDDLLKLVPEDMPVVLTLMLQLPKELTADSLKAHLDGEGENPNDLETREVALLWEPQGARGTDHEVAIAWGGKKDAAFLAGAFSGANAMEHETLCGHEVYASSKQMLGRIEKACAGKQPSMLHAAPEVLASLRAPASIGIGVETGRLLSQLTLDAYRAEAAAGSSGDEPAAKIPKAPPPEIVEAEKQLEALPYLGLRGVVKDGSLVPGGNG